jgi:hypothetical protein
MLGSPTAMNAVLRTPLLALVALLTLVVAGCGGGDKAASVDDSTSVDQLLKQTFTGTKKIDSGRLDLALRIDVSGGSNAQLQGPVSLKLSGPFETQGKGRLPKFDMDAAFEGAGQSLKAGVASTGDKGFVNFNGTEYAVSDQIFQQFKAGYEQAQKQSASQGGNQQSLATLGIDPRRWLTDAKNGGEAKVGDTDTIKITGGVDINKLLDDVNTALTKARGLGVQGTENLPEKLTDAQKKQVADATKNVGVEIYTGKDDSTLRRMLVKMDVAAPAGSSGGAESGTLSLDFNLLDLNESQDIKAPSGAKPFEQLLGQLGGLGLGTGGAGGGSGSSGSGSSGGASAEQLKKYSDCVTAAGSDTAKAQKCAELLSP